MSSESAGSVGYGKDDDSKHKASAKEDFFAFAEYIDKSVWFHALYGALDGLSVSYSTVKFLCDVLSPNSKEYHENLDFVLSDIEFWLPIIAMGTFAITLISYFGNMNTRRDKKDQSATDKFFKTYWPYIRDILKGMKNGYKGIKTAAGICLSLGILDKANFRNIVLPVGLLFGIAAIINRVYMRILKKKRKALNEEQARILKQFEELNNLRRELQLIYIQLQSIEFTLSKHAYVEGLDEKRASLHKRKDEIVEALQKFDVEQLKADRAKLQVEQANFEQANNFRLLVASGIAGIIDGPYLYVGMLSLATLPVTALATLSIVATFFIFALIATRIQEERDEQKKVVRNQKRQILEESIQEFLIEQQNLSKANLECFIAFKRQHPELKGTVLLEKFKEHSKIVFQKEYESLIRKFKTVDADLTELQALVKPSYLDAVIHGAQDGLTAFGALTSIYFALGIALLLMGVTFPPALIIGGVIFGMIAIATCVALRVLIAKQHTDNFTEYFNEWKKKANDDLIIEREDTILSPIDYNTDGLTKGEFYFQSIFEVLRCIANGPYKSENLTSFFLAPFGLDPETDHSPFILLMWSSIALVYGLVLTLRAIGSGFGKQSPAPAKQETVPDESLEKGKTPSSPSAMENIVKKKPNTHFQGAHRWTFFGDLRRPQVPHAANNVQNDYEDLSADLSDEPPHYLPNRTQLTTA